MEDPVSFLLSHILRRAGEGVGESQFGRLEKKPSSLSILCNVYKKT
jgi:hypothetical protein